MLFAKYIPHRFFFKQPSKTSRNTFIEKVSYFILVANNPNFLNFGIGEASPLEGLSIDNPLTIENKLKQVCDNIDYYAENLQDLSDFPSIQFATETALLDFKNGGKKILFNTPFITDGKGIPINGLIWMGNKDFMLQQIKTKLNENYQCIKIKIGAIDFDDELSLIQHIRSNFSATDVEIRVDANGAFEYETVLQKLDSLAKLNVHSIEQPIKKGQINQIRELCRNTPLPIALDEELIGNANYKKELLTEIQPQYIVLKPTLLGGIKQADEWIELSNTLNIKWWITSALETNIGLNAIAQWTATKNNMLYQGLGTGQLFTNNIPSPLFLEKGHIKYKKAQNWNLSAILH